MADEIELFAWCRRQAEGFRDWEQHEMAMFDSNDARDLELVEWVVRVLGNPELVMSREVLKILAERHPATHLRAEEAS